MGTIILVIGVLIVIIVSMFIGGNVAYKGAIAEDKPSYISDMEYELDKANAELDKSMRELKDKLSKELAKEIPKVVANGNDTLLVYLLYEDMGGYIGYPSVRITEEQYDLIRRHKNDTKWVDSQLLDDRLARYAMTYYVGVDYSCDDNRGIMLDISLKEV